MVHLVSAAIASVFLRALAPHPNALQEITRVVPNEGISYVGQRKHLRQMKEYLALDSRGSTCAGWQRKHLCLTKEALAPNEGISCARYQRLHLRRIAEEALVRVSHLCHPVVSKNSILPYWRNG